MITIMTFQNTRLNWTRLLWSWFLKGLLWLIILAKHFLLSRAVCGPQGLSQIGCTYAPHNYIVAVTWNANKCVTIACGVVPWPLVWLAARLDDWIRCCEAWFTYSAAAWWLLSPVQSVHIILAALYESQVLLLLVTHSALGGSNANLDSLTIDWPRNSTYYTIVPVEEGYQEWEAGDNDDTLQTTSTGRGGVDCGQCVMRVLTHVVSSLVVTHCLPRRVYYLSIKQIYLFKFVFICENAAICWRFCVTTTRWSVGAE